MFSIFPHQFLNLDPYLSTALAQFPKEGRELVLIVFCGRYPAPRLILLVFLVSILPHNSPEVEKSKIKQFLNMLSRNLFLACLLKGKLCASIMASLEAIHHFLVDSIDKLVLCRPVSIFTLWEANQILLECKVRPQ